MPSILHSYPSLLILIPFFFTDMVSNHDVVDCEGPTLKNHCYWPIVSDFINVLSHKTIAEMFMQNRDLIKQWLKFIGHLTGQVVSREVTSTLLMFQHAVVLLYSGSSPSGHSYKRCPLRRASTLLVGTRLSLQWIHVQCMTFCIF